MNDQFLIQNNDAIEAAKKWASMVQRKLRVNANSMKGKDSFVIRNESKERKLSDSISFKIGTTNDIISNLSFSFARHGVFVQKGVGRGYEMNNGFVIKSITRDSSGKGDHLSQYCRAQIIERNPNDWFNSVIDDNFPELADKLSEIHADAVFDGIKMLIK